MAKTPDPHCPFCRGTGWCCEAHPERPSDCATPDHLEACSCGAPGQLCDLCYPYPERLQVPPPLPPGFVPQDDLN